MANESMYRVTRPETYGPGTPGHLDPSARQGYYVQAKSVDEARRSLCARKLDDPIRKGEALDVQAWSGGSTHGMLLDEAGRPISKRFVQ